MKNKYDLWVSHSSKSRFPFFYSQEKTEIDIFKAQKLNKDETTVALDIYRKLSSLHFLFNYFSIWLTSI